jgi:hypothetical protein
MPNVPPFVPRRLLSARPVMPKSPQGEAVIIGDPPLAGLRGADARRVVEAMANGGRTRGTLAPAIDRPSHWSRP